MQFAPAPDDAVGARRMFEIRIRRVWVTALGVSLRLLPSHA